MDQLKLTNLPHFGKSTQNHNFSKNYQNSNFYQISIGFNKNRLSQFLGGYITTGVHNSKRVALYQVNPECDRYTFLRSYGASSVLI